MDVNYWEEPPPVSTLTDPHSHLATTSTCTPSRKMLKITYRRLKKPRDDIHIPPWHICMIWERREEERKEKDGRKLQSPRSPHLIIRTYVQHSGLISDPV